MSLFVALILATTVLPQDGTAAAFEAPPAAPTDSVEVHARAVLAVSEFFVTWQRLWRESEIRRVGMPGRERALPIRLPYVHCHAELPDGARTGRTPRGSDAVARPFSQFPIVRSDSSQFAACPTWILTADIPQASDEAAWRDGALVPALRSKAYESRARLIAMLDSAVTAWPGSTFLVGQLVRFRLDQRDVAGAADAVRRCRAAEWWCLALAGFVAAHQGASVEADSIYAAMRAAMTPAMRCDWMDVRALLPPAHAGPFARMSCAERERAVERLWWLSDPLYRERGNERRVAHETRRVLAALRRALDSDERHPWDARRGGDAMARLVERYGWPTYAAWGGFETDVLHSHYLVGFRSAPVPPYTTMEYALDRVQLLPSWTASRDPFRMLASDWHLAEERPDGTLDPTWWPREHMATGRRLVQLPEGQTVVFRRQSHGTLVTAHRVQHPLATRDSTTFDVLLLSTSSPGRVDSLDQRVVRGGETVVLRSLVASEPRLLAVEAMGVGSTMVDARMRQGLVPPPPLSAMAPGEIAISDPALIDLSRVDAGIDRPDEALVEHLLGSTVLGADQRRIGLYWETYGVASTDPVTVSVSLTSAEDPGGLRRLGMALRLASDPRRSLQIRWVEPSAQRNTRTLSGPVPVQLRSLVLNLAELASGPYVLTVSIARPGIGTVSSQRRLVLAP